MKGEKLWEQYLHYTQNLTEHCRKLGFAGIATCWLFHTPQMTFPKGIYFALMLFVAYFICDILHYFMGSLMLKRFIEREEEKLFTKTQNIDGDIEKPRSVDRPAFTFYCIKAIILMCGFLVVICEFMLRMGQ